MVQTAGNSCAVVDGAAAALVARASAGQPGLANLLATAVVLRHNGWVSARYLRSSCCSKRSGLALDAVDLFEINEAQS